MGMPLNKKKVIIRIIAASVLLLCVYNYMYASNNIIKVKDNNQITLRHVCYVYYQGKKLLESVGMERFLQRGKQLKYYRIYTPGKEHISFDINGITLNIQNGKYGFLSLLSGDSFSGTLIPSSAYTVEITNKRVSVMNNIETGSYLKKMTVGRGYKAEFDIVIHFKKNINFSKNMLKITVNYPEIGFPMTFTDMERNMKKYGPLLSNPQFANMARYAISQKETDYFTAHFIPVNTSECPSRQSYFFSKHYYYKISLQNVKTKKRQVVDYTPELNSDGSWTLTGADVKCGVAGAGNGSSVSSNSDGSIIAVGAPGNDKKGIGAGYVRVYQNIRGVWTQKGKDIIGKAAGEHFGEAISLSSDGSVIAVGSPGNSAHGRSSGCVRIYRNKKKSWVQTGDDINGVSENDQLGHAVSLSSDGTVVAIGAPFAKDVFYKTSSQVSKHVFGNVKIYKNIDNNWVQIGSDIVGQSFDGIFGFSVALSSDASTVAVGAPSKNTQGYVKIFKNKFGVWGQIGKNITGGSHGDSFGCSLDLNVDGSIIAVSALGKYVKIFKNNNRTWTQIANSIHNQSGYGRFGEAIDLNFDGSIVAVGDSISNENGSEAGQVRVYKYHASAGRWSQIKNNINGHKAGSLLGSSVCLNDDGSVVAAGAPGNSGSVNSTGFLKIYQRRKDNCVQFPDIGGEAKGDQFGHSISLSGDGSIVAIGAPGDDDNGEDAGYARVYQITGNLDIDKE